MFRSHPGFGKAAVVTEHDSLADLIERCRRRSFANLTLRHAAQALSITLGGFCILLLLGTQVLDWQWIAALFLAGAAYGAYRVWRRAPSRYQVAQRIDRSLSLKDSLSTAWFFGRMAEGRRFSARMRDVQVEEASRLAGGTSPQTAVPIVFPAAMYLTILMALLAGSLFATRYLVRGTLDLKPPLTDTMFDVFQSPVLQARSARRDQAPQLPEWMKDQGLSITDLTSEPPSATERAETSGEERDIPASGTTAEEPSGESLPPSLKQLQAPGMAGEPREDNAGSGEAARGEQAGGESPKGEREESAERASDRSPEESSLLKKLQDAMANLLAKLKMSEPPSSLRERQVPGSSQAAGGERQKSESGRQGPGDPMEGGETSAAQEGEQSALDAQAAQKTPGGKGDRTSDQRAERDAKSGIGQQDGAKEAKETEQLAAMGKISEIIGKRSENLRGEATIEVKSGKQGLRTQYSDRAAAHSEAGGEIHRDEIPLIYQDYVRSYFEELRKSVPASSLRPNPETDAAPADSSGSPASPAPR